MLCREMAMGDKTQNPMGFYPIRVGYGSFSLPMGLLMGKKLDPVGWQVWVWGCNTQTCKPMSFLNPVHPSTTFHILLRYPKFLN